MVVGSYNSGSITAAYRARPASLGASGGVKAFESFFHRLTEPYPIQAALPFYWDRRHAYGYGRRAFYSKFLVVSGGPDQQLGVFLYSDARDLAEHANTPRR